MTSVNDDLSGLLAAAESAAPAQAVAVIARRLRERFEAVDVSFLLVDLTGRVAARLSAQTPNGGYREVERIRMADTGFEQVIRTQQPLHESTGDRNRVIAPVTNRGDVIGVLEVELPPGRGDEVMATIAEAAHVLAYVVIANRRFTDLYTWGRYPGPPSLSALIQYQLLPSALSCEAAQFALCGNLEPSEEISGDSFDYTVDRDALYMSITDPMGHDLQAALSATVLVAALRGARQMGAGVGEQARQADMALRNHLESHATGLLARIDLESGRGELVVAGHPLPLLMRDATIRELSFEVDPPFGLPMAARRPFRVQEFTLRPGDRLVMVTDGMLERDAATVDLVALLRDTRHLHPRETALALTTAVLEASGGRLQDDVTAMCLDWHGGHRTERRDAETGADTGRASEGRR
ncbi:PP2C family protein-serine/threonine phosphatase [Stackebrandtia albiflava]|uniref:PP2C family protein-serine/threonine phosphatase n=1 Tax=Stackebrandtia albiflava TaxID=406432 RepID=UPI0011BE6809|nr:PP2C family protein-serine/threonine phosphatase [Stackebrandtia albiflava]